MYLQEKCIREQQFLITHNMSTSTLCLKFQYIQWIYYRYVHFLFLNTYYLLHLKECHNFHRGKKYCDFRSRGFFWYTGSYILITTWANKYQPEVEWSKQKNNPYSSLFWATILEMHGFFKVFEKVKVLSPPSDPSISILRLQIFLQIGTMHVLFYNSCSCNCKLFFPDNLSS